MISKCKNTHFIFCVRVMREEVIKSPLLIVCFNGNYSEIKKEEQTSCLLFFVPVAELFSNSFLEDLEKIWALRFYIPNPTKPILPPNRR